MINIDKKALSELKELMIRYAIKNNILRIDIDRYFKNGPSFCFFSAEESEKDNLFLVNDIKFVVDKALLEEFGGFNILSKEDNNGLGIGIQPIVKLEYEYNSNLYTKEERCHKTSSFCKNGCDGCSGCNK